MFIKDPSSHFIIPPPFSPPPPCCCCCCWFVCPVTSPKVVCVVCPFTLSSSLSRTFLLSFDEEEPNKPHKEEEDEDVLCVAEEEEEEEGSSKPCRIFSSRPIEARTSIFSSSVKDEVRAWILRCTKEWYGRKEGRLCVVLTAFATSSG